VEYFQPLITWLQEQNKGEILGWDQAPEWIPKEPPAWPNAAPTTAQISLSVVLVLASLVLFLKP
jgi:hypothetical protein